MSTSTSLMELSSPVEATELSEASLSALVADAVRAASNASTVSTASTVVARSDAGSMAERLERARLEARSLTAARASGRRAG